MKSVSPVDTEMIDLYLPTYNFCRNALDRTENDVLIMMMMKTNLPNAKSPFFLW